MALTDSAWIAEKWTRLKVQFDDSTFYVKKGRKYINLVDTKSGKRLGKLTVLDASSYHIGGHLAVMREVKKDCSELKLGKILQWEGPSHEDWPDEEEKRND